jgi:hypothetical protein
MDEITESEMASAAVEPIAAVQLDPLDFTNYKLSYVLVREAQLKTTMYERELARAQEELQKLDFEHRRGLAMLAAKHKVDLGAMMVSEDGFFMPRPPQALRR